MRVSQKVSQKVSQMLDPKNCTVLVVDDEEDLREAISYDFKKAGFNVLGASNGLEAFDTVKSTKVDIVLSDVRMPKSSGIDLLEKIKNADPKTPSVIFITGFADISLAEALDKGAAAIFPKPFDRKALMNTVMRLLSNEKDNWSGRSTDRIDSNFAIRLTIKNLNAAVTGKIMNIGRGGMFVALDGELPLVDTPVRFSIEFLEGDLDKIDGSGVVRWVRAKGTDLPKGCGIEFEFLNDSTRAKILELINELKTRAYIPIA